MELSRHITVRTATAGISVIGAEVVTALGRREPRDRALPSADAALCVGSFHGRPPQRRAQISPRTDLTPVPDPTQLAARLAGAVWGHLVGDAVGVPYEFRSARDIQSVEFGA